MCKTLRILCCTNNKHANIDSFSPAALAAAKPVILILLCFPPENFSDFNRNDLLGKHGKNKPNSFAL